MATVNHSDKIELDAFSDPNLQSQNGNGLYYRFTNTLKTPILNAKSVQLASANFINTSLQLNDYNGQLLFFVYTGATPSYANLRCVRLHPSNFVPYAGYTAFTKNKYFNSVADLVAALNAAASTGGDSILYNPRWIGNGIITFSYDSTTRKISISAADNATLLSPAAADDPNVADILNGTTASSTRIRMNTYNSSNTYLSSPLQPYFVNSNYPSGPDYTTMNARLGFAMSYYANPIWRGPSTVLGCATSTGVPLATSAEADAYPILLGVQNVNVYLNIAVGGGQDSLGNKNLIGSIPIDVPPLNINSVILNSLTNPSLSTPSEIYDITVELRDDTGAPFYQPPNFNTQLALAVFY
jgi:hypothetical protein